MRISKQEISTALQRHLNNVRYIDIVDSGEGYLNKDVEFVELVDGLTVLLNEETSEPMPQPHDLFKVHMLNGAGKEKAAALANSFTELLGRIENVCPEGRDLAIVRTKLQEASFFAKRAMACDPVNQENS